MTDRDKDIIGLRKSSQSKDRLKELEFLYTSTSEEKEQLNATLLQKNFIIDSLQTQVNEFESRIKELSNKTHANSSNPLLMEIDELNNLVHMKENEINKLRANYSLKEEQIREL